MSVIFTRPTSTQVLEHLFVGRRGVPQVVHCDNATNFVGASRHFEELRRKIEAEESAIRAFASKSGCTFAFIPPRAPHFGGLWEAGVKTAKSLLHRVVGSALLSAEELQTAESRRGRSRRRRRGQHASPAVARGQSQGGTRRAGRHGQGRRR
ncbi:hypothetical protein ACLKA7_011671 [Drosophila subpalustris]